MPSDSMPNSSQEKLVQDTFARLENSVKENDCIMFSTSVCPYCDYAKDFIQKFGKQCKRVELDRPENSMLAAVVANVTNQRTVPNIFLKGMHVGGYQELLEVEKQCGTQGSVLRSSEMFAEVCGFFRHTDTA
mmetsp:Transcript_14811/g.29206  ORF Transcript_14811/g.29206 Transcript_14811/m.29206 type:complete len:132 (-) Transcript_14811:74-469(-)